MFRVRCGGKCRRVSSQDDRNRHQLKHRSTNKQPTKWECMTVTHMWWTMITSQTKIHLHTSGMGTVSPSQFLSKNPQKKQEKKQSKKKLKQWVWMLIKLQLSRMKYSWHFVLFSVFVHSFASFSHARPGLGKTEMCLENYVWWVSKAAVILKVHESNPNQGGWAQIQSWADITLYN